MQPTIIAILLSISFIIAVFLLIRYSIRKSDNDWEYVNRYEKLVNDVSTIDEMEKLNNEMRAECLTKNGKFVNKGIPQEINKLFKILHTKWDLLEKLYLEKKIPNTITFNNEELELLIASLEFYKTKIITMTNNQTDQPLYIETCNLLARINKQIT